MIEDRAVFDCGVRARQPTSPDRSWKRRGIDREVVRRSMKRVPVLRPEPGASATVKRAKERGLDALAIPLFEVRPVDWDVPDAGGFDGLLLTSANAVRHSGEQLLKELRGLPVRTVGASHCRSCEEAGFDVTSSGEAGVERLLGSLEPDLKLLHLAGEDRRTVDNARQEICTITVYRSKARDGVAVRDVDGSIALLHSPRAGKRFAELAESAVKSSISIAAISEGADAAGDGWATVEASGGHADRRSAAGSRGTAVQQPGAEMNTTTYRRSSSWGTAAPDRAGLDRGSALPQRAWALAQYIGRLRASSASAPPAEQLTPKPVALANTPAQALSRRRTATAASAQIAELQARLERVEERCPARRRFCRARRCAGRRVRRAACARSRWRSAASSRFWSTGSDQHQQAVGTIIASSRPAGAAQRS